MKEREWEKRMRHIYHMARTKTMCKRDVVGSPCMSFVIIGKGDGTTSAVISGHLQDAKI